MKNLIFTIALIAFAITGYAVQTNTDSKASAQTEKVCAKDSTKACCEKKSECKTECKSESKKDCARQCDGTAKNECKADSTAAKKCCDKK